MLIDHSFISRDRRGFDLCIILHSCYAPVTRHLAIWVKSCEVLGSGIAIGCNAIPYAIYFNGYINWIHVLLLCIESASSNPLVVKQ